MLQNLGLGPTKKGRKDLRGKQLVLVDDGLNPYRTMCFTVAAKIVRRRGGEVETIKPEAGQPPHAKVLDIPVPKGPRPGPAPHPAPARKTASGNRR